MSEQTPSYGFTNTYEPSPQAKALGTVIEALKYRPDTSGTFMENLMNPANLYVTPGMVKGPGWGAEALRRYRLLGGTPETLNKALTNRAMDPNQRNFIVQNFRGGTDIAAPDTLGGWEAKELQDKAIKTAGNIYESMRHGGRTLYEPATDISEDIAMGMAKNLPRIESGAKGNAAYSAVSRQVARMLDTPGFYFKRAQDLPSVSAKEYNKAFPREEQDLMRVLEWERQNLPRAHSDRPRYTGPERRTAGGGLDRRVLQLFDDWQRDERTLSEAELRILRHHYGPSFPD